VLAPDALLLVSSMEGVPSALAAARDGVDALLRDRELRRTTPELTTESLLRGAAASATLEGSGTDLEALRSGEGDEVAIRAARLNGELLGLVPVLNRSPLQALARLHTLAAAGTGPHEELGRPRQDARAAARLQALCRMLLASSAPAIAVAAVAHAEIASGQPFARANGLVGRALERLLLVARGVDPTSMTVPELGHLSAGPDYPQALASYAEGTPEGSRAWLLYSAHALGAATDASPLNDRT
jgi:hypothetical protein